MCRTLHAILFAGCGLWLACEPAPSVRKNPTWADVEPILRGQCNHCHGATSATTGSIGGPAYRLDFFDLDPAVCGEASAAVDGAAFAGTSAKLIGADITASAGAPRARMPPAPAQQLADWERETILRWAASPQRGTRPVDNQFPRIRTERMPATADQRLAFTVIVDDPDGESVVGVLKIGPLTYRLDRAGSFAVDVDTSTWTAGARTISAVLCDGWRNVDYEVGRVEIRH